jgi:fructose-bisphosphate aldolase class I
MDKQKLEATAKKMVAPGKGILAADESFPTIAKRFESIGVKSDESVRNEYREMLFTTKGLGDYISGVILFDETLRSNAKDGTPFPVLLKNNGILSGIKVDKGLIKIAGNTEEKATQGLDGLGERVSEYFQLGAEFAKWRAVITIGNSIPTSKCIEINAHLLARYAAICQEAGLVPIVEPEILMNGSHDIKRCEEVSDITLHTVFSELFKQGVFLEGMILKPSMVISGISCPVHASSEEIAEATVRCFKRTVPAAVPGCAFLSGGQTAVEATVNLNAMNSLGNLPWELSFSYGRALQQPPLETWQGKKENKQKAQDILYLRAKCNGAARYGKYSGEMENS